MKLVVNKCYGGFSLSEEQALAYGIDESELFDSGIGSNRVYYGDFDRDDAKLIDVVIQDLPGAWASKLQVVEIPDGVHYEISDYDGWEEVIWSESQIHHA